VREGLWHRARRHDDARLTAHKAFLSRNEKFKKQGSMPGHSVERKLGPGTSAERKGAQVGLLALLLCYEGALRSHRLPAPPAFCKDISPGIVPTRVFAFG